MQCREDLPPDLRRRFRTGRPCLDLVHTGGAGALARWELVHDAADLGRWLAVVLGLEAVAATEADLTPMRMLRAALTRAAYGTAAGRPPDARDVATINAAAVGAPLVPALRVDASGSAVTFGPASAPAALATLARDAVDLFGGPLAARIRVCAAPDCDLLLLDTSRPGRRRWCSMQRCGNLAKVRRHRTPPA